MIIDTNVYSALDGGDQVAIDAVSGQMNLYLPVIVVGELRYGFLNGARQKENEQRLIRFLAQGGVEVIYPTVKTTELYAQLSVHCRRAGRALSNNDIWIAALAKEHGVPLVTYDKDFIVLEGILSDKVIVLED